MSIAPTSALPKATVDSAKPLVVVEHLVKHFPVRGGVFSRVYEWVKAVDDVSFTIGQGRTLGLVGESGCGKTTVGRAMLRLIAPTSGQVIIDGQSVFNLPSDELRALRREMQIIF